MTGPAVPRGAVVTFVSVPSGRLVPMDLLIPFLALLLGTVLGYLAATLLGQRTRAELAGALARAERL